MSFEPDIISNQPIVIDNVSFTRKTFNRVWVMFFLQGSGVLKAGFAGDDLPKTVFPSYVGRPKHTRVMAGAVEGDTFVGSKAEELRGLLKLKWVFSNAMDN